MIDFLFGCVLVYSAIWFTVDLYKRSNELKRIEYELARCRTRKYNKEQNTSNNKQQEVHSGVKSARNL